MKKEEFYYDSFSNKNKIHAIKWVPEGTPLCIIQIVHGMAEHIGRYEEFAAFLTERNILVVGEDHLGHGLSMGENPPGYFCEKNPGKVLIEDVRTLKNIVRAEYPDIPCILFGHSMGSFIVRLAAEKYVKPDRLIIMGTGGSNPLSPVGIALAETVKFFKGPLVSSGDRAAPHSGQKLVWALDVPPCSDSH